MDNPYWSSSDNTHHIDLMEIKRKCFELLNIFWASESLSRHLSYLQEEDDYEEEITSDNFYKLHTELSHVEISKLLLQIAFMLRTYDDVMLSSKDSRKYKIHRDKTSGIDYLGNFPDGSDIRTACNKIIHANSIRPIYDHLGIEVGEDIWYLTGEIELECSDKNQEHTYTLHTQDFISIVLDRINFNKKRV